MCVFPCRALLFPPQLVAHPRSVSHPRAVCADTLPEKPIYSIGRIAARHPASFSFPPRFFSRITLSWPFFFFCISYLFDSLCSSSSSSLISLSLSYFSYPLDSRDSSSFTLISLCPSHLPLVLRSLDSCNFSSSLLSPSSPPLSFIFLIPPIHAILRHSLSPFIPRVSSLFHLRLFPVRALFHFYSSLPLLYPVSHPLDQPPHMCPTRMRPCLRVQRARVPVSRWP